MSEEAMKRARMEEFIRKEREHLFDEESFFNEEPPSGGPRHKFAQRVDDKGNPVGPKMRIER